MSDSYSPCHPKEDITNKLDEIIEDITDALKRCRTNRSRRDKESALKFWKDVRYYLNTSDKES